MALASFLNFFESFKSFQFATSSSSAQSSGDIESIETQGLQMYPFGIQHYQKAITISFKTNTTMRRDYGLLQRLRNSSRSFCTDSSSPSFKRYDARDFVLDVRGAEIAKDIESLADDGSGHDPRFTYMKNATFCRCTEPQDHAHGAPNIWKDFFVGGPGGNDPNCKTDIGEKSIDDKLTLQRAVVLTIGWERNTTQLVTFDRALPTPVDELRILFLDLNVLLSAERCSRIELCTLIRPFGPYEVTGPLMSHLDDNQPCYDNDMIKDFRDLSLKNLTVDVEYSAMANEDEILRRMREEYQDAYRYGECEFQSLEFTNMTMYDQMKAMLDSDVVIGMHGAGMFNVLWTRPKLWLLKYFLEDDFAGVIAIFANILAASGTISAEERYRDPLIRMDKFIPYPEWKSFFDSLFRNVVDNLEKKEKDER
ncbi:Glycosyltransferase AER61, uncharacterized [Phytophthora cactorum]|nr:Glycosyltransferase AER61, uncharacterized [Phytophthora cactorum]